MNNRKMGGVKRSIGLDMVRCCAILFVISGHFFLNTPFLNAEFSGASMHLQALFRKLFGAGVPLFIMLTGYLNAGKTPTRSYFLGGRRVLTAYLFFSAITIFFRQFCLHEALSLPRWILKILDFSAIPYGWYIEMWIGLFLLTPFLNIAYNGIRRQRDKLLLLAILYAMTALPDLFNRYGMHLVPGYWQSCYPLMFYFAGRYIREYRPTFRPVTLLAAMLACCLVDPLFNSLFVGSRPLLQVAGGYYGILGTIIAIAFFLLVYQVDFRNATLARILARISLLSLDMYLCSYIFDAIYYPLFRQHYFHSQPQFGIFFFVLVPLVFLSSFLLAGLKSRIFRAIGLNN